MTGIRGLGIAAEAFGRFGGLYLAAAPQSRPRITDHSAFRYPL